MADAPVKVRGGLDLPEIKLGGEFTTRMQRWVRAFMGYDPQQDPSQWVAGMDRRSAMHAIVANLDSAPFRSLGQSFRTRLRVPAPGAGLNTFVALNNVSKDDGDLVVLDYARISGGAGDVEYGVCGGAASAGGTVYAVEQRSSKRPIPIGTGSVVGTPLVGWVGIITGSRATANIFVDQVDADIWGVETLGGVQTQHVPLEDVVVWSGVSFFLQQITAAIAFNVTIKGRFYRLGKELA